MRKSGVLLHISSLPSPGGIGTMGQDARDFVDFLAAAGQSCWQILPLGPTSYGDSPYQSFSSFAGNPYFIDPDTLAEQGLLEESEYKNIDWEAAPDRVNYGALYQKRFPVLRTACARLLANPPAAYADFCREHSFWLPDYARFMAIKTGCGGAAWTDWPLPLRRHQPEALAQFDRENPGETEFWQAVQYLFFTQWNALKAYANQKGIAIIGDLPIYVARDSAAVWANPGLFQLDEQLEPIEVSGCPPDAFSADGQLWGNPLFNWEAMEQDGFAWWRHRIAHQCRVFDTLRIDHFRGMESYYAIPGQAKDARGGRWRKGPGIALVEAIRQAAGESDIIAEDLGYLTQAVRDLLQQSGFPGMKVMEFAFDSRENSDYLPHTYPRHCVVYSGTHDNSTLMGWMENARPQDVAEAREYLALSEAEGWNWGLMRGVWSSVGDLAVVQMQDLLGLDDRARMNAPSTVGQNWCWRMLPGAATPQLAQKVHEKMRLYRRLPAAEVK